MYTAGGAIMYTGGSIMLTGGTINQSAFLLVS